MDKKTGNEEKDMMMQRLRVLYLFQYLLENTDSEHTVTMPQIIDYLDECGCSAARKAIYSDLKALKDCAGVELEVDHGRNSGYRITDHNQWLFSPEGTSEGSSGFTMPELQMLANAISSSIFLTKETAQSLLTKLTRLCSKYQAEKLRHDVYVTSRPKSVNEKIFFSVNEIQFAIDSNKQISFKYFDYDTKKRKKFREGLRVCSPYAIVWDRDAYYLVAYYDKHPESLTNFRIDRMEGVTVLAEEITVKADPKELSDHLSSCFSMFTGQIAEVKLRFTNNLVNPVLDRFGHDIKIIPEDSEHFTIRPRVKPTMPFFSWMFQFGGNAEILEPANVREEYKKALMGALEKMSEV